MAALLIGLIGGVVIGALYLFGRDKTVRRTLASSILLGVVVGILVELARRPIATAVFMGLATIFIAEFFRWILSSRRKR